MSTKEVVFGKNGASVITWLVRVLIVLLTLMEARNEYRMREWSGESLRSSLGCRTTSLLATSRSTSTSGF